MSKNNPRKTKGLSHKVIFVKWFDIYSQDCWMETKKAKKWGNKTYEVKSVGWLIDETDNHILLAGGISNDDKVTLLLHIPKPNIIQRIEIDLDN